MPKAPKTNSSRKPPEPSPSHAEVASWIGRGVPALQPVVARLDELIRETIPGLQYAIKWKQAYYGLPKLGWIIQLAAYDVSANVVFLGGADFKPPPPLGSGRSRYVKVRTLEEANAPELRQWIEQAGRVAGWK